MSRTTACVSRSPPISAPVRQISTSKATPSGRTCFHSNNPHALPRAPRQAGRAISRTTHPRRAGAGGKIARRLPQEFAARHAEHRRCPLVRLDEHRAPHQEDRVRPVLKQSPAPLLRLPELIFDVPPAGDVAHHEKHLPPGADPAHRNVHEPAGSVPRSSQSRLKSGPRGRAGDNFPDRGPDLFVPPEQRGDVGDRQDRFPGGTREPAEAFAHVHRASLPADDEAFIQVVLGGEKRFPQGRREAGACAPRGARRTAPHRSGRNGRFFHVTVLPSGVRDAGEIIVILWPQRSRRCSG